MCSKTKSRDDSHLISLRRIQFSRFLFKIADFFKKISHKCACVTWLSRSVNLSVSQQIKIFYKQRFWYFRYILIYEYGTSAFQLFILFLHPWFVAFIILKLCYLWTYLSLLIPYYIYQWICKLSIILFVSLLVQTNTHFSAPNRIQILIKENWKRILSLPSAIVLII